MLVLDNTPAIPVHGVLVQVYNLTFVPNSLWKSYKIKLPNFPWITLIVIPSRIRIWHLLKYFWTCTYLAVGYATARGIRCSTVRRICRCWSSCATSAITNGAYLAYAGIW